MFSSELVRQMEWSWPVRVVREMINGVETIRRARDCLDQGEMFSIQA